MANQPNTVQIRARVEKRPLESLARASLATTGQARQVCQAICSGEACPRQAFLFAPVYLKSATGLTPWFLLWWLRLFHRPTRLRLFASTSAPTILVFFFLILVEEFFLILQFRFFLLFFFRFREVIQIGKRGII